MVTSKKCKKEDDCRLRKSRYNNSSKYFENICRRDFLKKIESVIYPNFVCGHCGCHKNVINPPSHVCFRTICHSPPLLGGRPFRTSHKSENNIDFNPSVYNGILPAPIPSSLILFERKTSLTLRSIIYLNGGFYNLAVHDPMINVK